MAVLLGMHANSKVKQIYLDVWCWHFQLETANLSFFLTSVMDLEFCYNVAKVDAGGNMPLCFVSFFLCSF